MCSVLTQDACIYGLRHFDQQGGYLLPFLLLRAIANAREGWGGAQANPAMLTSHAKTSHLRKDSQCMSPYSTVQPIH